MLGLQNLAETIASILIVAIPSIAASYYGYKASVAAKKAESQIDAREELLNYKEQEFQKNFDEINKAITENTNKIQQLEKAMAKVNVVLNNNESDNGIIVEQLKHIVSALAIDNHRIDNLNIFCSYIGETIYEYYNNNDFAQKIIDFEKVNVDLKNRLESLFNNDN